MSEIEEGIEGAGRTVYGEEGEDPGISLMLKDDMYACSNIQISEVPKTTEVMCAFASQPGRYKALIMDLELAGQFHDLLGVFLEQMIQKHYQSILEEARVVNATGT